MHQAEVVSPPTPPPDEFSRRRLRLYFPFARYLVGFTLLLLLMNMVSSPFAVDGRSMSPNLQNHDRVLVSRIRYLHLDLNAWRNLLFRQENQGIDFWYPFGSPKRGDIVVFQPPVSSSKPFIKRVIGLPGETVTFQDGFVYINGVRLDEQYIQGAITTCTRGSYCAVGPIPAGMIYVLGDNRQNSEDSRYFGPVSVDALIGEAWFMNWPPADIGRLSSGGYPELTPD